MRLPYAIVQLLPHRLWKLYIDRHRIKAKTIGALICRLRGHDTAPRYKRDGSTRAITCLPKDGKLRYRCYRCWNPSDTGPGDKR